MHELSIYLDTSIVSFLHADDSREMQEITLEFFSSHRHKYRIAISDLVLFELGKTADDARRALLLGSVHDLKIPVVSLGVDDETQIFSLADEYLTAGVIPKSKRDDAIHLAIATVLEFDVLLSWNFRHLANLRKQTLVNATNSRLGYLKPLNLLNPMEVMDED